MKKNPQQTLENQIQQYIKKLDMTINVNLSSGYKDNSISTNHSVGYTLLTN